MGESPDLSISACEDVLSQERGRAHHTPSAEGWNLTVLCWTHIITHQSFKSKGYIVQDFFFPTSLIPDFNARTHWHVTELPPIISLEWDQSPQPSSLNWSHKCSMKPPQLTSNQRCVTGYQEDRKEERVNNRWPFLDLCTRVYGQRIWELHCFTREQTGRKNPVKCWCLVFLSPSQWTKTKCIWYPYWHMTNKEQGLAACLPVKYK